MSSAASAEEGVANHRSEFTFWQLTVFIAIFLVISRQSICPVSWNSTRQRPRNPQQRGRGLSRLVVLLPRLQGIALY